MDKQNLQKYITTLLPMSPAKAAVLAEKFERLEVDKNTFLLKENRISRDTFVLESGYIRSFVYDGNGEEVTTIIFSPFCFVNDVLSFFKQQPAGENLQTVTPCVLWRMSYEDVQHNFHSIPEFREFGRMMLITNYANLKQRMLGMIKDSAEIRYAKLLEQHPDIFQNVPLKIIASYLGVTDTSLSRIRRNALK